MKTKTVKRYRLKKWVKVAITTISILTNIIIYSNLGYSSNINVELTGWLIVMFISILNLELWNN